MSYIRHLLRHKTVWASSGNILHLFFTSFSYRCTGSFKLQSATPQTIHAHKSTIRLICNLHMYLLYALHCLNVHTFLQCRVKYIMFLFHLSLCFSNLLPCWWRGPSWWRKGTAKGEGLLNPMGCHLSHTMCCHVEGGWG